jgi:hypothetical protein
MLPGAVFLWVNPRLSCSTPKATAGGSRGEGWAEEDSGMSQRNFYPCDSAGLVVADLRRGVYQGPCYPNRELALHRFHGARPDDYRGVALPHGGLLGRAICSKVRYF